MLTWAHDRGVMLRLIEPGKPTQNAFIESFNGRFRDECLNEHWFTSLAHARTLIEGVAPRVQRGATEERAGWTHACWLCQATHRRTEYSHRRTLNRTATESGGTSPAPCAAEPGEPRPKGAAPQKLVKLPLDEAGQALPVAQVSRLRAERLEVVAHHLVENSGRGLPRLVGRRREGHAPLSAEPVPRSATPETWGCLDDQAHDHAVSEPAIGTMGGSFLEAPVDWVRRIGTTLRACSRV